MIPIDFAHAKCWPVFSTNGAWEKTEYITWKSQKKNDKHLFAAKHVISLQHVRTPFMCLFSLEKCLFGFHFLENPGGNGSNENTVSSCPATIPHFLGGKMHKLDKGQNEQEPKTVGISSLYQSPQTLFHQSRPVSPGMGSALELVSRAPSSYVC
jgi:hypothetical protein